MQVHENNKPRYAYREGALISIEAGPDYSSEAMFVDAVTGSLTLGGKPVRCTGFVPGVTMRVSMRLPVPFPSSDAAQRYACQVSDQISPKLAGWLSRPQLGAAKLSGGPGLEIEFGRDGRDMIGPGAMHISVEHSDAAKAAYASRCARQPFIMRSLDSGGDLTQAQLDEIRRLFGIAVKKTERAWDALYDRLPVPVRYRAAGAIDAWSQFRKAAGRAGAEADSLLSDVPLASLLRIFPELIECLTQRRLEQMVGPVQASMALQSLIWQVFAARQGALYEPTPALHQLLDASYIADDVPVGMINLPADSMCIIPDPSWWEKGACAIALFKQSAERDGKLCPMISCVTISRRKRPDVGVRTMVFDLRLDAPEKTILQDLEDACAVARGEGEDAEESREHWRSMLDYVVKMLLYLSVRDAHVVHDRAYTNAPRDLSGLGRRKREERLAEIEQLYDRHIVGPAILDAEAVSSLPSDGDHHEVRGHWRRPHFRMQPHGPNSSLRKLAFIGPTIVRPDRLGL